MIHRIDAPLIAGAQAVVDRLPGDHPGVAVARFLLSGVMVLELLVFADSPLGSVAPLRLLSLAAVGLLVAWLWRDLKRVERAAERGFANPLRAEYLLLRVFLVVAAAIMTASSIVDLATPTQPEWMPVVVRLSDVLLMLAHYFAATERPPPRAYGRLALGAAS